MQKAYDPEDDLQEEEEGDLDVLEEDEDDEEEGWAEDYTGEDDW